VDEVSRQRHARSDDGDTKRPADFELDAGEGRDGSGFAAHQHWKAAMKFVHLFLIGYVVLAVGVAGALWQTGLLEHVSPIWIAIGVIVTAGIGIMMAVSSGKPAVTKEG